MSDHCDEIEFVHKLLIVLAVVAVVIGVIILIMHAAWVVLVGLFVFLSLAGLCCCSHHDGH